MDAHGVGTAEGNPKGNQKRNPKGGQLHQTLFEEDRSLGSSGFENQKDDQRLLEIHDDMATREKEKKDKKFAEIDSLGTTIEIPSDMARREKERRGKKKRKGNQKKRKGKTLEEDKEKLKGGNDEKDKPKNPKKRRKPKKLKDKDLLLMDRRNQDLLSLYLDPKSTWEETVVAVLHMVRCRGFTEYNKKLCCSLPTHFCAYNIAFFDLDKESEDAPWPPMSQIPRPLHSWLDDSVNIIAIKVAKSDVKYPISIYGTVLARDEYDYRCIYLFRRGRDDPQLIPPFSDQIPISPYLYNPL